MARRLSAEHLSRCVLIGVFLAGCSGVASRPLAESPVPPDTPVNAPTLPAPATDPPVVTSPDTVSPDTVSPDTVSPVARIEPTAAVDHVVARSVAPLDVSMPATTGPGRLVLIGDSIADQLCAEFPEAACVAFPGGWVADVRGVNLTDGFVTQAHLQPDDTVVLSSIGGWHSPGVDDAEILRRLQALYHRLSAAVHRLIVLVPPYPNFTLCVDPSTPEAVALLGTHHDELCHTQQLIADLERSWPVTEVPIIGPYVSDQEHQTPQARRQLAQAIRFVLGSDPGRLAG